MGRLFRVHPFTWCGWVRWSWQGAGIKDHVMVQKRKFCLQNKSICLFKFPGICQRLVGGFQEPLFNLFSEIEIFTCHLVCNLEPTIKRWLLDVIFSNFSDHSCQLSLSLSLMSLLVIFPIIIVNCASTWAPTQKAEARKWWLKLPQCSFFCFAERNPDISKMMNSLTQKLSEKRWLICQQNVALGRLKLSLTEVTANTVVQLYTAGVC